MRHDVFPMGGMGSRIALGLAVSVAAFGTWVGTANAGATIVADPTEFTFLPGPYVQDLGEIAIFDNSQSASYHDVTATRNGPDGRVLFGSEMIPGGETTEVAGTQYLTAGTYPFFCTLHGDGMRGDLVVDGSKGKVVPRPSVKVSFVAQKLKKVRKSGVRIKLKGLTASKPVMVTATKGKVIVGVKRGLKLSAGQTKTFTLPLTKAGRKAIKKGKVVQIKLKATVPYGKPSSATRKLR